MKLNLACGNKIFKGYINLDYYELEGVDIVHDLNKLPLPFQNDTFDEIEASFILEHVNDAIKLLEEIYRISKDGCLVNIKVPYWNSVCFAKDITHKKGFHENNFYILDPTLKKRKHFYPNCFFKIGYLQVLILEGHYCIKSKFFVNLLLKISPFIPNIVRDLKVKLITIKNENFKV